MADGFQIDTREFDKALVIYSQAVQKDAAYIVNRTALNVAIKTAAATPRTAPRQITNLLKKEVWWKVVTKRLKKKGRKITRANRERYSEKMQRQRLKVRGYLRSGWNPAMRILTSAKAIAKGTIGTRSAAGTKQFKNPPGGATPAQPGVHVRAEIWTNADGAQEYPEYLQRGMDAAAADMVQYAHKLMSDTARKHSAK